MPNHAFFGEVERDLVEGHNVLVRPDGDSMMPLLRGGRDIVELAPITSADIRRGAVVFYNYRGHYMIHRIVGINDGVCEILGDGNITPEYLPAREIIGVVCSIRRPSGRVVAVSSRRWKMCSALWMALRPARRYILWAIRKVS